ncbi:MAG: 50S ribosomal protein L10 [Candidatus Gracilibacteria bacterium]|jgi:large subunit ribosomal protein L10|nr:50S ribosomal protein L10 [Candidatus Gracilibacteria bacterium]
MAISRSKKEQILQLLIDNVKESKSVIFAENKGLTVEEISDFRSKLRESDAKFTVSKKTLIKKALKENAIEEEVPTEAMIGSIGTVFSFSDELSGIKAATKFAKDNEKLVIHGGVFEGKIIDANHVTALSEIPSKEELLAKLLGSMQSPISGFVGVGNSVISSFVRALSEVSKQKESA